MAPTLQVISLSLLFVGSTFAFGPHHCNLQSLSLSSPRYHSTSPSSSPPPPRWYYDDTQTVSRPGSIISCGGYNKIESNLCFSVDSQSTMIHAFNDLDESTLQLQQVQLLQQLALWVFAFASSHIGMSAARSSIISFFGDLSQALNCVDNKEWVLSSWWPGDDLGGTQIFPDALTAGRQIYRAVYTVVSFFTLSEAFDTYLDVGSLQQPAETVFKGTLLHAACLISAALSYGAVAASLFNASPLGLMPGFNVTAQSNNGVDRSIVNSIVNIRRDDTLKFTARGLTLITRHPLILPVVPWGIANAILAGARSCDYILFGGLSIYAIAGCFAQDLRVLREEGSVGTVFRIDSRGERDVNEEYEEREQLRRFFEATSFIPFQAVFDGRQCFKDIISEIPWLPFVAGTVAGVFVESWVLQVLQR